VKKVFLFLALTVLFFGCLYPKPEPIPFPDAVKECISLCKEIKAETDFSSGPCIANPLEKNPDYVCDIAHNPREEVDNQAENQCSAFREGKAKHFVELNEECGLIKEY